MPSSSSASRIAATKSSASRCACPRTRMTRTASARLRSAAARSSSRCRRAVAPRPPAAAARSRGGAPRADEAPPTPADVVGESFRAESRRPCDCSPRTCGARGRPSRWRAARVRRAPVVPPRRPERCRAEPAPPRGSGRVPARHRRGELPSRGRRGRSSSSRRPATRQPLHGGARQLSCPRAPRRCAQAIAGCEGARIIRASSLDQRPCGVVVLPLERLGCPASLASADWRAFSAAAAAACRACASRMSPAAGAIRLNRGGLGQAGDRLVKSARGQQNPRTLASARRRALAAAGPRPPVAASRQGPGRRDREVG